MRMNHFPRLAAFAITALVVVAPVDARAQLDPLLFVKTTQPNVILAVETANRMQRDAADVYYDPGTYNRTGSLFEAIIGLAPGDSVSFYRRKYLALEHLNPNENAGDKFRATRIETVGDQESDYSVFYQKTRLGIARLALYYGITENLTNARFALIKTRQATVTLNAAGNEGPVTVTDITQQDPTDFSSGKWHITRPSVATANSNQTTSGLLTAADAANANPTIVATLSRELGTAGALVPAGTDAKNTVDAPVGLLLDDARAHAASLIASDIAANGCRNTIVVLIVGGGEGTINPQNLATKASTFLNVSGRRVPIYVIAIAPQSGASDLQDIAENSGGQYFEITADMINATATGQPVAEVVRAVNLAVQHSYVASTAFNTAPTNALPFGPSSEFEVTSPIVGTVNLRNATKLTANGTQTLPDSETYITNNGTEIPQRSNVLVTTGFALPGFEGKLRAFRVYKPVPDSSKPSGFKFTQDGSRLWVSSTPDAGSRNIFTVLPGSTTLVPFTAAQTAALTPYLRVTDPATLIDWIRSQPVGAIVGSTPAFLDPPSLDPPPDSSYPAFREANKDRRSLIFVGANDGMLHAFDARTGVEVWAFIPFNLLPKLKALRGGQSMDAFKYFVDSSPKISDVKVGGTWKTYLFFGQGPGGTFYNAIDVTLENINGSVSEESTSTSSLLTYFSSSDRIKWKWSFPLLTSFDPTIGTYGDIAAGASAVEKSVGETWSDPAIGQVVNDTGSYVMAVGSGFLKYSTEQQANRAGTRAGTTFYLLDVETGEVRSSRDVGADGTAETGTVASDCRAANDCRRMKNALQMDPVATGPADQRYITKVYIGDLDGRVWRFDVTLSGTVPTLSAPVKLYEAGSDYPLFASMATVNVGGSNQYLFVGTGSDLLPSNNVNQSYSLLVLLDTGNSANKTAEILLERTDNTGVDEKVTFFPAVAGDIVFFTTTGQNTALSCNPFTGNLYAFTFIGGPAYDTNNDGTLSTGTSGSTGKGKGGKGGGAAPADSTKVFSTSGARATAPFIVDQHLVFSAGGNIEMFGDPDDFNNGVGQAGVRILSWRVVK